MDKREPTDAEIYDAFGRARAASGEQSLASERAAVDQAASLLGVDIERAYAVIDHLRLLEVKAMLASMEKRRGSSDRVLQETRARLDELDAFTRRQRRLWSMRPK